MCHMASKCLIRKLSPIRPALADEVVWRRACVSVTQSRVMLTRRALVTAAIASAFPQTSTNKAHSSEFRTELPHPRLLLPARRARLLQRESERNSLRWTQFHTLVSGKTQFPEPGFAYSVYFAATKSEPHARLAIEWALSSSATDLRQLAIVFDWCGPVFKESESKRLVAKMQALIEKPDASIPGVRDQVFAAIALTEHVEGIGPRVIMPIVESWWKGRILSAVQRGEVPIDVKDHMALFELFHALRDNYDIDLRDTAAKFFTTLPIYHILAHYPAPFPAPENEYRIPLMKEHAEPDLRAAARTRAAALSMVAYDTNSQEMQFLQGWLIQDRFLMRGPYGIPYEFLWANPYQPGLSFHYLPNVFHDPVTGRLLIRSTWEEDAVWFYQSAGVLQLFEGGQIRNLTQEALTKEIVMGNTILLPAQISERFKVDTGETPNRYYIFGLQPKTRYDLEVDDEEIRNADTDKGGVLELNFPRKRTAAAILRPSPKIP